MEDLKDPRCKRFFRKCEDFTICVNIGENGYVLAEHPNERFTIFYYGVKGQGKFGKPFESDHLMIESNVITDVQDYVHSEVLFQAMEDFFLIGFNTLDKNVKWEAELLTSESKVVTAKSGRSFLFCLDGDVVVNDKKFKRYDYAEIFQGTEYNLNISEKGALGLFSKKISIL
jgi:hypothetical protein